MYVCMYVDVYMCVYISVSAERDLARWMPDSFSYCSTVIMYDTCIWQSAVRDDWLVGVGADTCQARIPNAARCFGRFWRSSKEREVDNVGNRLKILDRGGKNSTPGYRRLSWTRRRCLHQAIENHLMETEHALSLYYADAVRGKCGG